MESWCLTFESKIFEISQPVPLPLSTGEGWGGGGKNRDLLVLPPLPPAERMFLRDLQRRLKKILKFKHGGIHYSTIPLFQYSSISAIRDKSAAPKEVTSI